MIIIWTVNLSYYHSKNCGVNGKKLIKRFQKGEKTKWMLDDSKLLNRLTIGDNILQW